jgi:sugar phosphate isomerase/epimerase
MSDDLKNLAIHTITNKPWSTRQCIDKYAEAGISGITFWLKDFEDESPATVGDYARATGLEVISVARGGFFCAPNTLRRQALLNDNYKAIEQSAEAGAPSLVLVCGSHLEQSLEESRHQILTGIEYILPRAQEYGVKLAVEPLHPTYAADRSAINTMATANEICDQLGSPEHLGIAVDTYHTWWDPELQNQIKIAGQKNRLFGFHICDWKTPTLDPLNDRGIMGEGSINNAEIRTWMSNAGFHGKAEIEIFSNLHWATDQDEYLQKIITAYQSI